MDSSKAVICAAVTSGSLKSPKTGYPEVLYPYVKGKIVVVEKYYILLDEVQLLGEFESVLNGFMRIPNVDV